MEEAELLVDAASRLSEPFLLVIVVILCLQHPPAVCVLNLRENTSTTQGLV